jgi:hypothetical protein
MAAPHAAAVAEATADYGFVDSFVMEQSQLFKTQHDDDPTVTVDGCLKELIEQGTIAEALLKPCLAILAKLHTEDKLITNTEPLHIFHLRDEPYYKSLVGRTKDEFEVLNILADYLGLPKELNKCIERHQAVEAAKSKYREAIAGYNIETATEPKPRLYDFYRGDSLIRRLASRSLASIHPKWTEFGVDPFGDEEKHGAVHIPGRSYLASTDLTLPAFVDGLLGEDLSEYGKEPGGLRVAAYCSGCIAIDRTPPLRVLEIETSRSKIWTRQICYETTADVQIGPARVAAALGKVDLLREVRSRGCWREEEEKWMVLLVAGRFNQVAVLEWLKAEMPDMFAHDEGMRDYVRSALCTLLPQGNGEAARWFTEQPGLLDRIFEDEEYVASLRPFTLSACQGNLFAEAQSFHARYPQHPKRPISAAAVKHANFAMLQWSLDNGFGWHPHTLVAALKAGRIDIYDYCIGAGCPRSEGELAACVEGFKGNLSKISEVLAKGALTTQLAQGLFAKKAAELGCIPALELMDTLPGFKGWKDEPVVFTAAVASAVEGGQKDVLIFLLDPLRNAVAGSPHGMRSLMPFEQFPLHLHVWDEPTFGQSKVPSLPNPDTELLELLGPQFDVSPFYIEAVRWLNIDAARWLASHGFKFSLEDNHRYPFVVSALIEFGKRGLPMLRCLTEECGLVLSAMESKGAAQAAAQSGSAAMLIFVLSQFCEHDNSLLRHAMCTNRIPMLRLLRERRPDWNWSMGSVARAKRCGAAEAAAWACERGAQDEDALAREPTEATYTWNFKFRH